MEVTKEQVYSPQTHMVEHGVDVIAEGVETREQLEVIMGLGCELVQGHLFAPPLPAEAARALLATGVLA